MRISNCLALSVLLFTFQSQAGEPDIEQVKKQFPELYQKLLQAQKCIEEKDQCQSEDKKKSNPRWWLVSSYDEPYEGVRQALSTELSLKLDSGNKDGYQYLFQGDYNVRKGHLSNFLSVTYYKEYLEQGSKLKKDIEYYMVNDGIKYDFNRKLYNETGFVIERDSSADVDRRTIYYTGLGAYLLQQEDLKLSAMLAVGKEHEKYMGDITALLNLDSQDFSVGYLYQTLSWQISKTLRFSETFRLFSSLEDIPYYESIKLPEGWQESALPLEEQPGYGSNCKAFLEGAQGYCLADLKYKNQVKLQLKMEYLVNSNLSFAYNYLIDHDSLSWPGSAATNTAHNIGVRYQF